MSSTQVLHTSDATSRTEAKCGATIILKRHLTHHFILQQISAILTLTVKHKNIHLISSTG
jgi:hypothetical protein